MLLPPTVVDVRPDEELRHQAQARSAVLVLVLALDVVVLFALRGSPAIRQDALRVFGEVNLPLLALDLAVVNLFARKRTRVLRAALCVSAALEVTTVFVWLQLTGIVSSYFLIMGPVLIAGYRSWGDYWIAFCACSCFSTFHLGVVVAEDLGYLRPASLFVEDPGGLYSLRLFRWIALLSIEGVYSMVFWATNFTATSFREKDAALSEARRDVERAVEDVQHGRLVGETIGGYRLVELLGRGGMGEVYRAERIADGRAAALKVMHRHLGTLSEAIARFRREIDVVRRLQSRGVTEILDAGETGDGLHYLAMELLRGEDLAALLRRREQLSLRELLPMVDQLADALDAAHAAGIIHRDVKPQNVFLASESEAETPTVKLLDFGVARLVETAGEEKLTATFAVVGTAGYLAPEQVAPSFGPIGPETDVFALGAVVYRALTGRGAFDAPHLPGALHAALYAHPAPPSTITAGLHADVDAVIALAIAKRPRHRYSTARAFAVDLRAAQDGKLTEDVRARAREFSGFTSERVSQTMLAGDASSAR
jgi:hypothetical protein